MRPLIHRRAFLTAIARLGLGILLAALGRARRAAASGLAPVDAEFVNKTRAGRYQNFYINYFRPMRRIKAESWRLRAHGLCARPAALTLGELKKLPVKTQTSRLKCVECWSAKAEWRGLHIADLERLLEPLPEAAGVVFHCGDSYKEYISRADLNHERALLAYDMDGAPLTDEHGFPLRLVIPFKYGYKNPKAIMEMEYVAAPQYGTWSKIGPYSPDGTILPGYDHPLDRGGERRRISGGEIFD